MAVPALLWAHQHITEREVAHNWPDGQFDNGRWEDCGWTSVVELARICRDITIPPTHTEVEHLRDDAGIPPSGGSNANELAHGLTVRYGPVTGWLRAVQGFDALWGALQPGYAAAVQGLMGVFWLGNKLRRWDRSFSGGHNILIARIDTQPMVWWCDPLAPEGDYEGEWVSKADLRMFINAFPGTHLVAKVKAPSSIPVPLPKPKPVKVPPVRFIQSYSPAKELDVPAGTQIYDLQGMPYTRLNGKPGSLITLRTTGLADAHSGAFGVLVSTGGVYDDRQQRLTELLVKLPGGQPR